MVKACSETAHQTFSSHRTARIELERFDSPVCLLDFLTDFDSDLDEKNEICSTLVELAQAEAATDLPMTLLFLGLWPGLDGIYRRSFRYYRDEPAELVSELWTRFSTAVGRADRRRINRMAATLVRNTERTMVWWRRREQGRNRLKDVLPDGDSLPSPGPFCPDISNLGLPPGLTPEQQVLRLREVLTDVVGEHADFVLSVAVFGQSQREAGERVGLSHGAAKMRYQRTLKRLRRLLADRCGR